MKSKQEERTKQLTEKQKAELQRLLDEVVLDSENDGGASYARAAYQAEQWRKQALGGSAAGGDPGDGHGGGDGGHGGGGGGGGSPSVDDLPDPEGSGRFYRVAVPGGALAAMLGLRACSWSPGTGSTASLIEQLGTLGYVLILALCLVYFIRITLAAPGRPDWLHHRTLAEYSKSAWGLVLVVGIAQGLIDEFNDRFDGGLSLPGAIFASAIPSVLFAIHGIVVKLASPIVFNSEKGVETATGDRFARTWLRYLLMLVFAIAAIFASLIAINRIILVFRALPGDWYESYLFWKWF